MKTILVFGAGKSATVLIDYLKTTVSEKNWKLIVADANAEQAKTKLGDAPNTEAIEVNVTDADERRMLIESSDLVISLLPPFLHIHVVKDCVAVGQTCLMHLMWMMPSETSRRKYEAKNYCFYVKWGSTPVLIT